MAWTGNPSRRRTTSQVSRTERSVLDGERRCPSKPPTAIAAFVARGAPEAARTKQEGALADMLAAMVPEQAQEPV